MGRIIINLPEHFIFKTTIPVQITDLNYGGHLANDRLLSILHEARVRFLKHFNYTEFDCAGVSLIMADVGIEYTHEAFYGDHLTIHIVGAEFKRVSFNLYYRVETEKALIAKAKTGLIAFDYDARKVIALPDTLREVLSDPRNNDED